MSSSLEQSEVIADAGLVVNSRTAADKEEHLRRLFREMGSVLVAYSGGVDSTYVAYVATGELGGNALCVTGESATLSSYERAQSESLAEQFGFHRQVVETQELNNVSYTTNDSKRCYFCEDELYGKLKSIAGTHNIPFIVDGSTCDDISDYRPGRIAAKEHDVRSPLIESGMTKSDVRLLSRQAGLPTWDKPASPCLSSRVAYGVPVTIERLAVIEEGEAILRRMGFRQFRVRHHEKLVRLEISPDEMECAVRPENIREFARQFRKLGFKYVTLDLEGYRSGAMNEVLSGENQQ